VPTETLAILNRLSNAITADTVRKEFPKLPKPEQITVSEIKDSGGEDAYQVVIVYPDSVAETQLDLVKTLGMTDWIRKKIFEIRGDNDRWPYFRFRRKSDLSVAS